MKFVLLLLSCFATGLAEIREITTLSELYQEIEKLNSNSFIVFDIDEVLVTSEDLFFHPSLEPFMLGLVAKEMERTKDKKLLEERLSLSLLQTKKILVDAQMPTFLKQLKAKGKKALAITHFPTGPFGKIPLLESLKIKELLSFQIDFSPFFEKKQKHLFPKMAKAGKPIPFFENGILFCREHEKGKALTSILDWLDLKPAIVVAVDDLKEHLENIQTHLEKRSIPFKGFHFKGLEHNPTEQDQKTIQDQLRFLIEKNQWVSDQQMKKAKEVL